MDRSASRPNASSSDIVFEHSMVPIERLRELEATMNSLAAAGRLSENETFRGYIRGLLYRPPESMPEARSVVVLAVPTPLMFARFHLRGRVHDLMMPPQYYSTGLSADGLRKTVLALIAPAGGRRAERASPVPLKSLAVRSGLAAYGRNSVSYVDGMGSFLTLYAFFTDAQCSEDPWREPRMMPACDRCRLCIDACPCACITAERPLIDAGRCITLYNEVEGEFPPWMDPAVHNAIVGCMRCQLCCPANRDGVARAGRLEDVTEEETERILAGRPDADLLAGLSVKLSRCSLVQSEEYFPVLTRNLRMLLEAAAK